MDPYFSLSSKTNYFRLVTRFIYLKVLLKRHSRSAPCERKLPEYHFFLQINFLETRQWRARGTFSPPMIQRKEMFHDVILEVLLLCESRI